MRLFTKDTKVEALRRVPLFEGLSKRELELLAQVSEDVELPAGEALCREGQSGQEFFVIVDGEVEVKRRGRRVSTGQSGDFFGEIALVEDMPRTASVIAKTPLRVFVLTARDFRSVVERSPGVERKVLRTLARRLASLSADPGLR